MQDGLLVRNQAYIDGAWVSAKDGSTFAVTNPATDDTIVHVPNLGVAEANLAIAAADAALPAWRARTGKERAAFLRRWYELMMEHAQDLAAIMTAEQGKPLAEAMGEVAYGASFVEWFAEEAKRVSGDVLASTASDSGCWCSGSPLASAPPLRHGISPSP
jgi:succinate-semialdehyde dehydrogenase/glutarate-semialdehyde dehydrogenase